MTIIDAGFTWCDFFKMLSKLPREERKDFIRTQFNKKL